MWILCICFCVIMGLAGTAVWFWKHLPEGLSKEQILERNLLKEGNERAFWFDLWYPLAYKIYGFLQKQTWLTANEEKINQLQKLYVGCRRESLKEFYFCYRVIIILWLITGFTALVMLGIFSENGTSLFDGGYGLSREEPGGGQRQITLKVRSESEDREVTVTVPERTYTREEVQAKMMEAREYILKSYLGENPSSEKVSKPLILVSKIPDNQIQVKWKLDSNGYVNADGTLNRDELSEAVEIHFTAVLKYGEEKERIPIDCTLLPQEKTKQELFWEKWNKKLESLKEESRQETVLSLPEEVDGIPVSYQEKKTSSWLGIFILGLFACILTPAFLDYRMEQKIIRREEELQREYPEIVERFILLIGAGLTIRGAWYRITEDYEKRCETGERQKHILYEEMLVTRRAMENGQSEMVAYSDFGRRMSLIQYMRFNTMLTQNLKKGSKDLLQRMDFEAKDALRERRELARKSGEEAGTKLLIPMMLMLVIVFAMILIAAFQNL